MLGRARYGGAGLVVLVLESLRGVRVLHVAGEVRGGGKGWIL